MARLCYINNIATRPQKREREKKNEIHNYT